MAHLRSGTNYNFTLNSHRQTTIIYDLETTGFNPYHNHIIEIAAVKISPDGKKSTFHQLVNPGENIVIPPKIVELTNINPDDVKSAPDTKTVLNNFYDFVNYGSNKNEIYLIAHNNNGFDRLFIENWMSVCNIIQPENNTWKYIDTLRLAQKLIPDRFSYSLKSLCKTYDIIQHNHHRADDDTSCLSQLYDRLCHLYSIQSDLNYNQIKQFPSVIHSFLL